MTINFHQCSTLHMQKNKSHCIVSHLTIFPPHVPSFNCLYSSTSLLQYPLMSAWHIESMHAHHMVKSTVRWWHFAWDMFITLFFKLLYHHHLPPWIRSFDLFQHRRTAIVSWGGHGHFFLEVCSWGRVSGVWCCPFFQGGCSSFVCIWVSRLVFQRSLVLSL